jgi:hypothetical protein
MADSVLPSDSMLYELQYQILWTKRKLHRKKKKSAAHARLANELLSLEEELQTYVSQQQQVGETTTINVLRWRGG